MQSKLDSFFTQSDNVCRKRCSDEGVVLAPAEKRGKLLRRITQLKQYSYHEGECSKSTRPEDSPHTHKPPLIYSTSKDTRGDTTEIIKTKPDKYTPLEEQFIRIKSQYPDAILFVECGYKYRFFGSDAEIAAKELDIFCHPDHNFMTASIPVHRLYVHIGRLVSEGYKVGVVDQTETAALKAIGDSPSSLFTRELTALYTVATLAASFVGQNDTDIDVSGGYMLCVCETRKSQNMNTVGMLAVHPATGDVLYDEFTDTTTSSQLDTRMTHIQPVELVHPQHLSEETLRTLQYWHHQKINGCSVRKEVLKDEWFEYTSAFAFVSDFYKQDCTALQLVINLPSNVICCLSAMIQYLIPFKLERTFLISSNFHQFDLTRNIMQLNSNTLKSLEIFRNQTNGQVHGTLLWVLDHTHTLFGKRLLEQWIAKPLMSVSDIKARQEAVTELSKKGSPFINKLREVLKKLPDVERSLTRILHGKCSPVEFTRAVGALVLVEKQLSAYHGVVHTEFTSQLLITTISQVVDNLRSVEPSLLMLNEDAAKTGDMEELFIDPHQFPDVLKEKNTINTIKNNMQELRKDFAKTLHTFGMKYTTVMGTEYLIEVSNDNLARVPSDWMRINSTKHVTRYHPPQVVNNIRMMQQHKEQLKVEVDSAWKQFLSTFSIHYNTCKLAVHQLATIDCLLSLSHVANMPGYTCPSITGDDNTINITNGRHPIIELLLSKESRYVANDTMMSLDGVRNLIITGPNMGGKSSYVKQVSLICIMAQMGCYVPAEQATVSVLDAVYTRMGASDNIAGGHSTFMTELTEVSDILHNATNKSLVLLDELGRGTSTFDGLAIAYATLNHFITEVQCYMLFITHYQLICELQVVYSDCVKNYHMSYLTTSHKDTEDVTLLYHLEEGQATKSYGLSVARLADIPDCVLQMAATKASEMEGNLNWLTVDVKLCNIFTEIMQSLREKDLNRIVKIIHTYDF
ncbi:DNA mismatch repair protein Msh3-like isoform X2 [Dysidea avara]|uniref:DNA mismatch repair protein Msh3-like isoform X2 n=1 Tax=Dysidea avara TaxID=196820 RepID=UPI00332D4820